MVQEREDMALTPKKRILVLRNNLAFNAGIQRLLSNQDALEVMGQDIHDQNELFQCIAQEQPDVLIVDDGILTTYLADLLVFLQNYPQKRLIVMDVKESQIQIYDMKQIQIEQIGEFLSVLYS